jgi:hypothetical protein
MATQTPVQRSAAAKRAAATRKRDAAKRSASTTRTNARRTGGSASRTAVRSVDAAESQFGALATSAQRVLFTAVGALASAGDAVKRNARTYTDAERLSRELGRFERRGARVLNRDRRSVRRRTR